MSDFMGVPPLTGGTLLVIVTLQVIGGSLLWRLVKRGPVPIIEVIGMGFALGTVIAALASQVTVAWAGEAWGWIAAPLAGLTVWVGSRTRRWHLAPLEMGQLRGLLMLLPAFAVGLIALIPSFMLTPLNSGYIVGTSYQPDLVFQEALAQSVSTWGPGDSSLLSGQPIRYHWLAYSWIGNLTDISNSDAFVVMTRIFPIVILIAAILLAASWARALSDSWWVPGLAALLVVGGGYIGALQGVVLTYDSPSTAFAAVLGIAFAIAMTLWSRTQSPALLSIIGMLAFALVGAKVSQALVIAVGVVGVCVWALISRKIALVIPLAFASAVGMGVGYLVFLAGVTGDDTNIAIAGSQEHASTFQGLDPFAGATGIAFGTLALLLAIAPRWIGAAWLARAGGVSAEVYFAGGLVFAGAATLFLLRSGTNAAWFALAATALLSVLSAVGVGVALTRAGYARHRQPWIRDPLTWALVLSVIINLAVLLAFAFAAVSGAPVLWRGPLLAWLLAILGALFLARFGALRGSGWVRWAAMVTVLITLTSLGARINGSLVWTAAHSRATPVIADVIRVIDPGAEPPAGSDVAPARAVGGWPQAGVAARSDGDGVARPLGLVQWTPAMDSAARALRDMSTPGDVVAVSYPILQPYLPIVSERRAWLAGLPYSVGYTTKEGVDAAEFREAAVQAFLTEPSNRTAETLSASQVTWLWVTPESFNLLGPLAPWTESVMSNKDVVLLRLTDAGSNSE